jgi:hypothetical protein
MPRRARMRFLTPPGLTREARSTGRASRTPNAHPPPKPPSDLGSRIEHSSIVHHVEQLLQHRARAARQCRVKWLAGWESQVAGRDSPRIALAALYAWIGSRRRQGVCRLRTGKHPASGSWVRAGDPRGREALSVENDARRSGRPFSRCWAVRPPAHPPHALVTQTVSCAPQGQQSLWSRCKSPRFVYNFNSF